MCERNRSIAGGPPGARRWASPAGLRSCASARATVVVAWALLAGALAACAPRAPLAEPAFTDGDTLALEPPLRLAAVGGGAGPATVDDILGWDPHLVLILGDAVPRSGSRHWEAFAERWRPLLDRLVVVPGPGEHRGDRRLRGLRDRFPGHGVDGLEGGWWHLDLAPGDTRWRLVFVDGGAADPDQGFWLPKVVSGDGFDRLIVAVGFPVGDERTAGALDIVADHAGAVRLAAVLGGGAAAVDLPEGPYGPVHLDSGAGAGGWWTVRVDGESVELVHREASDGREPGPFRERTRMRLGDTGWRPASSEP